MAVLQWWSLMAVSALLTGVSSKAIGTQLGSAQAPLPTPPGHLEYFLVEELPANLLIGNVATDTGLKSLYNESIFKTLRYGFVDHGSERQLKFAINNTTGIVKTNEQIDREAMCGQEDPCLLWLHVAVSPQEYRQIIDILVEVVDKNDHPPTFQDNEVNIMIPETIVTGSEFELPSPTDPDSGKNGIDKVELIGSNGEFELAISKPEGDNQPHIKLVVKQELDREHIAFYRLKIVAQDGGTPQQSGSLIVNVLIQDANDNDPKFDNVTYEVFVNENIPAGTSVVRVHASDPDDGLNGQVVYGFDPNTEEKFGHIFGINATAGTLFLKAILDFEVVSTYMLEVTARDMGSDSQAAHAHVVVRVEDTNDNPPNVAISTASGRQGPARVDEGQPPGLLVATVMVTDQDGGENGKVECGMAHEKFALSLASQSQYQIITRVELDREITDMYDLIIRCQDNADPPQITLESLVVEVMDINDHSPVFSEPNYQVFIQKDSQTGTFVLKLDATDMDKGRNAEIRYSLPNEATEHFKIDPISGVVTINSQIGHESSQEFRFQVIARDMGNPPRSTTTTVNVVVANSQDQQPSFTQPGYAFGVFENELSSTEVGSVEMDQNSKERFEQIEFLFASSASKDSQSFSIDPKTGQIVTRAALDRETRPVYYLTVLARSRQTELHTGTVSVTVYVADRNDNKPVISNPHNSNTTLYLSSNVPVDHTVTHIQATDSDIGDNGKLTYYISNGNENKVFKLEPSSGKLNVAVSMKSVRQKTFDLLVLVRDHGFPHQTTLLPLKIVINQSNEYNTPFRKDIMSSEHATLVVSLTAAALIIVFVVCFAILVYLVWRRNYQQKQAENYPYSNATPPLLNCFKRAKQQPEGGADSDPEAVRSNTVNFDIEQSVYPAPWCQKTLNTEYPVSPVCSPQYPEGSASLAISNSHLVLEKSIEDSACCSPEDEPCKSGHLSNSPPGSQRCSGSEISLISGPGVSDV